MAQSTFSVCMDDNLKKEFDTLCSEFGMNASTAFNIFARAVVYQRRIPFEICAPKDDITLEEGMQAFWELRKSAEENGIMGMSLEEINAEINAARNGEGE
ncbi:MAG: type II toxin-antitoxin system RelB/DinJ family antitoxin [Ruminococcus sp.]|nr:type II toxin-antitoxin system RelB/DinJ family antitoxin [Ruminococcus sp.]